MEDRGSTDKIRPDLLSPIFYPRSSIIFDGRSLRGHTRAQFVIDALYARDRSGDVFGPAFVPETVYRAAQSHSAVMHTDHDVGRVQVRVIGQAVSDVLADAFIVVIARHFCLL